MRVAKTGVIAGVPTELARAICRKFRGREMVAEIAEDILAGTGHDLATVFAELEATGYLKKVQTDHDGDVWWDTTVLGNALAMASFGKPISRKTADRLVTELLDRARAYNTDSSKPMFIDTLRVFGSYLDPDIDPIGDVDIELAYGRRIKDQAILRAYTKASGRSFNTYMDELLWPSTELFLHLKKPSAFISITLEDISLLTDRFETIYRIDDDPQAPYRRPTGRSSGGKTSVATGERLFRCSAHMCAGNFCPAWAVIFRLRHHLRSTLRNKHHINKNTRRLSAAVTAAAVLATLLAAPANSADTYTDPSPTKEGLAPARERQNQPHEALSSAVSQNQPHEALSSAVS
ncbi:hypothetical protein [Pseudarthrobacter enclensis]|uniref:Uncharacterized protein n=1 Tax=Pseudarthrobacter enclensis TaxID=993070 RepID=A0ABT9RZD7_9MICC|nr:hypothetical protein [Pseudarthrobacter enclensis]MDP9890601.1 hypothetical protein [Pseudarthrobacter enclensis]